MAAMLGPEEFQRQLRLLQRRPDQQKTLRKANIPTLILAGGDDRKGRDTGQKDLG